ncbi:unnamed protein product [Effrenium voratum]|uniref:JmjC domain-containing protein n=1 Tax=Effrenium voratum TaxID=2562239 RepID=A0AA36IRF8_9DINO|nr:unnamed protein product [Effrenium voratum]CAJ1392617.1 unnamed protein product [Effrenium voratum]CAJ1439992.1 unnamed protein product [Effrenium voratum]
MSILGGPLLEDAEIEELLRKYPRFKGALPHEARLWTEAELETYLASGGQRKPADLSDKKSVPLNCGLLTKARLKLAELKVESATSEYVSYCRHRQQRSNFCSLPDAASCSPVQRVRQVSGVLTQPVTLVPKRGHDPIWRGWGMSFWKEACGLEYCNCRTRWPAFEHDEPGIDGICIESGLTEYLEYMLVVELQDPACMEDQAMAFPRLQVGDFCPFITSCSRFFRDHYHAWSPGVEDLTLRWCQIYAAIFEQDPLLQLAQFYRLHFGVIGAVSRLHKANHQASEWLLQLEGQRLFFLFPPEDGENLYELQGGYDESRSDGSFGFAASCSEVNVFFPSQKRHPLFSKCNVQVSLLGEGKTLVIPPGWWWCAVCTQPSVTMHHTYWGFENRLGFVDTLWAPFDSQQTSVDARNSMRPAFAELREALRKDDGRQDLEQLLGH